PIGANLTARGSHPRVERSPFHAGAATGRGAGNTAGPLCFSCVIRPSCEGEWVSEQLVRPFFVDHDRRQVHLVTMLIGNVHRWRYGIGRLSERTRLGKRGISGDRNFWQPSGRKPDRFVLE